MMNPGTSQGGPQREIEILSAVVLRTEPAELTQEVHLVHGKVADAHGIFQIGGSPIRFRPELLKLALVVELAFIRIVELRCRVELPILVDLKEGVATEQVVVIDERCVMSSRRGKCRVGCSRNPAIGWIEGDPNAAVSGGQLAQRCYSWGVDRAVVDDDPFPITVVLVT